LPPGLLGEEEENPINQIAEISDTRCPPVFIIAAYREEEE
jgi:hypothetical protein